MNSQDEEPKQVNHTHDIGCFAFIVLITLILGSCTVCCKYIAKTMEEQHVK